MNIKEICPDVVHVRGGVSSDLWAIEDVNGDIIAYCPNKKLAESLNRQMNEHEALVKKAKAMEEVVEAAKKFVVGYTELPFK